MFSRKFLLGFVLIVIGGTILYLELGKSGGGEALSNDEIMPLGVVERNTTEKAARYPQAVEIVNPSGFLNTEKITLSEFVGKNVILVDFWTYSCINCQRTLPYLTSWYEKYKDKGLVIVGVHTPEFEFEKDIANVKKATEKFGVTYPVVLDNDYATWRAYGNRYWPRKYVIDIDGFIVYDHIGEGAYDETERIIQELLAERNLALGLKHEVDMEISVPKEAEGVDFSKIQSPETYFGSLRNSNFSSGVAGQAGSRVYSSPSDIRPNSLYLEGSWNITGEFAENGNPGAKIIYKYQAKKVFLVASSESAVKIKVIKDGKEIKALTVQESGLYRLVEDDAYESHLLEIIIESPGLKAFAFTFG